MNWIENRKSRILVSGSVSGWKEDLGGVPQGSVLGPLLLYVVPKYEVNTTSNANTFLSPEYEYGICSNMKTVTNTWTHLKHKLYF